MGFESDVQTRKFQAVISHVHRGSKESTVDSLHLTEGKKWGRRSLGRAWVTWPHHFKAGDLVEIEWKISKLNASLKPMFPYDSLWNLLFMVLFLLGVSWIAGFVASTLYSWIGLIVRLIVLIVVFIVLWHPLVDYLERQGRWRIWETAPPPLETPKV
ncbi:hypothetical protein MUP07_00715 [Candidatus Bathyarchaeota archaeon]|nr:hypothetical protein [Candidatus Bathyarchaeota archaeon]